MNSQEQASRTLAERCGAGRSHRFGRGAGQARGAVLLALFEHGFPSTTLGCALDLSRALDTELHVVRVLPQLIQPRPFAPWINITRAFESVEQTVHASRTTRTWLGMGLAEEGSPLAHFSLKHGDFVEQVSALAAKLDAALVVVPPGRGRMGRTVRSLVHRSGVPVLLARGRDTVRTIMAGTDLLGAYVPVLRHIAEPSGRPDSPSIAVHSIAPTEVISGSHVPFPVTVMVLEARDRDADVVVVGTRRAGWLRDLVSKSVAAKLVNRSQRSVLVMPVADIL